MSEDGNLPYVFTNIKAMYEYIEREQLYSVSIIEVYHYDSRKYTQHKLTYNNINSLLKKHKPYAISLKKSNDNYGTLEIQELYIKSK